MTSPDPYVNVIQDHAEEERQVEPDGNALRGKGRDTKGLSGGEKSFSTICLLLSMWEGKYCSLEFVYCSVD